NPTSETITLRGTVVGPEGRLFAGATVFATTYTRDSSSEPDRIADRIVGQVTTNATGSFSFAIPREPARIRGDSARFDRTYRGVATAAGFGPDMEAVELAAAQPLSSLPDRALTLRLVPDTTPVEGRIVNLEGQPISGVRVRVETVMTTEANLEEWVAL